MSSKKEETIKNESNSNISFNLFSNVSVSISRCFGYGQTEISKKFLPGNCVEMSRPYHHQTHQKNSRQINQASLVWVAFPRNASILCAYSASRTDVPHPMESAT